MKTAPVSPHDRKQTFLIPFIYPAPAAREVMLVGDFNNWDPKTSPKRKGPEGVWHLNVQLEPGRHEYRFVADGVWQDDPYAQQRTPDKMGGENCVKQVDG
jgi:1,4-alpha-glucan branching enzyme